MGFVLKNDPVNPSSSCSPTFTPSYNISPDTFIYSQELQIVNLGQELVSFACLH